MVSELLWSGYHAFLTGKMHWSLWNQKLWFVGIVTFSIAVGGASRWIFKAILVKIVARGESIGKSRLKMSIKESCHGYLFFGKSDISKSGDNISRSDTVINLGWWNTGRMFVHCFFWHYFVSWGWPVFLLALSAISHTCNVILHLRAYPHLSQDRTRGTPRGNGAAASLD